jgi:tetratricopeptide (TPR) repeat protein
MKTAPPQVEDRYLRGVAMLKVGRYEEALAHFVFARDTDPRSAWHHVAVGLTHYHLADADKALACCQAALEIAPDFEPARRLRWCMGLHGENYYDVLSRIHTCLKPRTYVEIGVGSGSSVGLANPDTCIVAIDPNPAQPLALDGILYRETSDDFFAKHDLQAVLRGLPVDLAFIDGMHLFEFALRDFINLERYCTPHSLILMHDTYPLTEELGDRHVRPSSWVGDVWKTIVALREYRPELRIETVVTPPSGLTLIRNLDPSSRVLPRNLEAICTRYSELRYADLVNSSGSTLNLSPNNWECTKALLPEPFRS